MQPTLSDENTPTHWQELRIHALDELLWLEAAHAVRHAAGGHAVLPLLHLLQHSLMEVIRRGWPLLLQPPAVVVER